LRLPLWLALCLLGAAEENHGGLLVSTMMTTVGADVKDPKRLKDKSPRRCITS